MQFRKMKKIPSQLKEVYIWKSLS